jgi:hypothetical protein
MRREDLDTRLAERASEGRQVVALAAEEITGSTTLGVADLKTWRYRVVFKRQPTEAPQ